jgi:diacylglycerol kinase
MGLTVKGDEIKKFSLTQRFKSFRYAFNGLGTLLRYEHNTRIHIVILVIVIVAGILLRISGSQWMAIIFVTGLVFVSESFNTAVEYLSDQISLEMNKNIRRAKDVAAAGVLISAIIAVMTGLMIFLPEIFRVFKCWSI